MKLHLVRTGAEQQTEATVTNVATAVPPPVLRGIVPRAPATGAEATGFHLSNRLAPHLTNRM
jgi:hypothetical protein